MKLVRFCAVHSANSITESAPAMQLAFRSRKSTLQKMLEASAGRTRTLGDPGRLSRVSSLVALGGRALIIRQSWAAALVFYILYLQLEIFLIMQNPFPSRPIRKYMQYVNSRISNAKTIILTCSI